MQDGKKLCGLRETGAPRKPQNLEKVSSVCRSTLNSASKDLEERNYVECFAPQPPTFMNQREENQLFDFFFFFSRLGNLCHMHTGARYHLQLVHTLVHSTRATAAATSLATPSPIPSRRYIDQTKKFF